MPRRPSRHAAETSPVRRLGVLVSAAVVAVAAAVALVVFGVSALGGSSTSAADPTPPGASLSAPNAPAPRPSHSPLPAPYVQTPTASSSAPSAGSDLRVVTAGAPFRRYTLREQVQRAAARTAATQPQTRSASLSVGTLNVLGSQHTAGAKSTYGPGTSRAAREASLIESRGLDVVGLQEVQRDQLGVFTTHLPGYAVFPQTSQSSQGYRLQIAYRTSRFTPVDSGQVTYLFSHMWIPLPWILLRDDATGAEFYVIDAHNSPEGEQTERVTSSGIEIKLIDQLKESHPVIFLGDLNETGAVYCRIAAGTGVTASEGATDDGSCHVPGGYNPIDWLMGTAGVTWSDNHIDGTTRAQRMSDHNLVYATAAIEDSGSPTLTGDPSSSPTPAG